MEFSHSVRTAEYRNRLSTFIAEHIAPRDAEIQAPRPDRWSPSPVIESLKPVAQAQGLWNLFLPDRRFGPGLTNLEYAPLAEEMGRFAWCAEVFNCSAPDTGNMEVLAHYASPALQQQWLTPLLEGRIRSAYVMTEPEVASSDATNIAFEIRRDGEHYVLNGRKWWITGLGDPRCELLIVFGNTGGTERHRRHSMIVVPRATAGVRVERALTTLGYDDAPHGHFELSFENVRVPASNLLLGEGRGFEMAQGRLGPGRIHHCMRSIGAAERALELMCQRLSTRSAFGQPLSRQGVWRERIAESRCRIDMARLLTLKAAYLMDTVGNKGARKEIAMIKVVAPNVACQVIDWAIQAHGAAGICDDFGLGAMYAMQRSLRIADGPDEVHRETCAKLELKPYESAAARV